MERNMFSFLSNLAKQIYWAFNYESGTQDWGWKDEWNRVRP